MLRYLQSEEGDRIVVVYRDLRSICRRAAASVYKSCDLRDHRHERWRDGIDEWQAVRVGVRTSRRRHRLEEVGHTAGRAGRKHGVQKRRCKRKLVYVPDIL